MQSKRDFSQWGAGLFAGLLILLLAAPLNVSHTSVRFLSIVLLSAQILALTVIHWTTKFVAFFTHLVGEKDRSQIFFSQCALFNLAELISNIGNNVHTGSSNQPIVRATLAAIKTTVPSARTTVFYRKVS